MRLRTSPESILIRQEVFRDPPKHIPTSSHWSFVGFVESFVIASEAAQEALAVASLECSQHFPCVPITPRYGVIAKLLEGHS